MGWAAGHGALPLPGGFKLLLSMNQGLEAFSLQYTPKTLVVAPWDRLKFRAVLLQSEKGATESKFLDLHRYWG